MSFSTFYFFFLFLPSSTIDQRHRAPNVSFYDIRNVALCFLFSEFGRNKFLASLLVYFN